MEIKPINPLIFREYDIRGIFNETLNIDDAYLIGKGFASQLKYKKNNTISVGMDGRLTSPVLSKALIKGILDTGTNVIDIGCCPTPMLYFSRAFLNTDAAIMITGSHNPANHNGFKMMIGNQSFYGQEIKKLEKDIQEQSFLKGSGKSYKKDINDDYQNKMLDSCGDIKPFKVVWDCGNGATGDLIRSLVKELPGDHHVLFGDIDGNFPNHHPDPSQPENLLDLQKEIKLRNADLGIAFDGDGDRIGIVSCKGEIIPGDLLTAFLAGGILKTLPNSKIILDIKSSELAVNSINSQGGQALLWKTGHSLIKTKLKEISSPLAGEMSGHIFWNEGWNGMDDGPYVALRVLKELGNRINGLEGFINNLPPIFVSPEIRIECDDKSKFNVIKIITEHIKSTTEEFYLNDLDGIRVSTSNVWWLLRASNTQAAIVGRAEGYDENSLNLLINEIEKNLSLAGLNWSRKDKKI